MNVLNVCFRILFQSAKAGASVKKPGELANPVQNKHALRWKKVLIYSVSFRLVLFRDRAGNGVLYGRDGGAAERDSGAADPRSP